VLQLYLEIGQEWYLPVSSLLAVSRWPEVLGLCGKVLVAGEVTGMASMRSCKKLPSYLIETMPAGSKMDPPLAKAKPISDDGSSSVITYLRRGKNCCTTAAGRLRERNNSADTKVSEGGGGGAGVEIPLQPMEKTMLRQGVPPQYMEVHSGADIHLQPMENPTPEQVKA